MHVVMSGSSPESGDVEVPKPEKLVVYKNLKILKFDLYINSALGKHSTFCVEYLLFSRMQYV